MQDPWIERLSEYLDEELDRSERETLEAHLTRCSACSSAVKDLKAVRERARSLSDAPVPAELWSRIESGIASGRIRSIPADPVTSGRPGGSGRGRGGRSRWGGQFSFSLPELIAACLGIAILSGGAVFALVKHQAGIAPPAQTSVERAPGSGAARESAPVAEPPARQNQAPATSEPSTNLAASTAVPPEPTGREAVNARRTVLTPHEEAIAEIRKALARERNRLDPATVRALESNLAIIDLAIDQAKRALLADPANTYVKEHLAETMRRKVELIQRATMLASTSNSEGTR